MPNLRRLPGVVECMFCGSQRVVPEVSLHDLAIMIRARGYQGKLTEKGLAIAAICPTCEVGDCPNCGHPVSEHCDDEGLVLRCDGTRR
jgi:hypothetical protein